MLAEATNAASEGSQVVAALQKAAAATGSDFDYLLSTAERESSLKPQAQATTSSAAGLFQFVEQTWLGLMKEYGAKYGLGSMAAAITKGTDGRYHADNAADRQAILALRKDPQVAALMEGEYANESKVALESELGRNVCGGELYAAHFLGPDAACKLIRMSASQPNADAAAEFPAAASANRSVFYHADGTPKTAREVYDWALKQPSGKAALAQAATTTKSSTPLPGVYVQNLATGASGMDSVTTDVSSWTPSKGFFGDAEPTGTFASVGSLLSPSVMDVLAQMSGKLN